jgi:hypothetical protein
MTERSGRRGSSTVGLLLAVVVVLTTLVAPRWLNFGITIESAGANRVVIPVVYWMALAAAAAVTARHHGGPFQIELARTFVAGFAAHMLLLLAASAGWMTARSTYSTSLYWWYVRAFYFTAIAAACVWTMRRARDRQLNRDLTPVTLIGIATAVLVFILARHDPVVALAAAAGGAAVGALRFGSRSRVVGSVFNMLADERLFLAAVFALGLAIRLAYAARVMTDPNYIETGGDARFYDRLATSLANGQSIADNGYPLLILGYVRFLAIIYKWLGHSYMAVCIVQSLIGAGAAVGIYVLGKPVFGAVAARIAAVFTAVSFQLAFSAVAIGHQALDIGLTVLLIWSLIVAFQDVDSMRWWMGGIAGAIFGCAVAVRETNAFFLLFTFVWLFWLARRAASRRFWEAAVTLTAGTAMVLAPLIVPMISSESRRTELRRHLDRLATSRETKGREGLVGPATSPRAALAQFREQPAFVLGAEARTVRNNFATQFFTQPYGEFDLVSLRKESDYYYGLWCYAYLLTLIGMTAAVRRIRAHDRQSAALALMLGLVIFRTLPHLFLESGYRHRAPLEPFLILFCAAGVMTLWQCAWPTLSEARPTLQAAS